MRADEMDEVRAIPLFAGVGEAHVTALLRTSFLQRFPAHVDLIREGEPADFLNVVVDGHVEVYAAHRGRETTVAVIGRGHSFIAAAVVLDRVNLKSARTLTPSRILLMPADAVRQVFATDAAFARALAVELALGYRAIVKELKNQKLRSSLERLASWIVQRDVEAGCTGRFELPFEKRVLASRLGMAPEVLSRTFGALAAYGVEIAGRIVTIGDRDALMKLARPTTTIDDPES